MKLTKGDKYMLREQFRKAWHDDERMVEHCMKRASGYIEIGGLIIVYDKPHIETRFCFGEHGYDYEEVNERCQSLSNDKTYFKLKNLQQITDEIKALSDCRQTPWLIGNAYWNQDDDCKLGTIGWYWRDDKPKGANARPLTEDEKQAYIQFLGEEAEKFEKRLRTYLKRYGLTKCHYGVYLADR